MNEIEFKTHLKNAQKILLKTSDKYFFDGHEAPKDEIDFIKYIENDIAKRPKYKGDAWYVYDEIEFSINLNPIFPEFKIFKDNPLVDIIDNYSSSDFELSGIVFMEILLNSKLITKNYGSRDEGIDFYGFYKATDESESDFFDVNAWYIGQTKCYPEHQIKTNHLRELVGTLELAKRRIWSINDRYPDIDIKDFHHTVPVFITKSRYSNDCYKIANLYDIKLLDDIDLLFWTSLKLNSSKLEFEKRIKLLKDE